MEKYNLKNEILSSIKENNYSFDYVENSLLEVIKKQLNQDVYKTKEDAWVAYISRVLNKALTYKSIKDSQNLIDKVDPISLITDTNWDIKDLFLDEK